jgi:hypothetical protein
MVDTGATGLGFIDRSFAQEHDLKRQQLERYIELFGYNDSRTPAGRVTHVIFLKLDYQGHKETIKLFETDLGKHQIILGQPWMERHRMIPNWDERTLICTADDCGAQKTSQKTNELEEMVDDCKGECQEAFATLPLLRTSSQNKKPNHSSYNPPRREKDWKHSFQKQIDEMFNEEEKPTTSNSEDSTLANTGQPLANHDVKLDICAIGAAPMLRLARKKDHEIFSVTLEDIDRALARKTHTDPKTKLPPEYHAYLPLFSRKEADKLPEHRASDHRIITEEGKQHGFGPLYAMSLNELKVLRKYLDENLEKGFIRPSSSPVACPVIFVRKPGGGLRFYVDYRKLNEIIIKNRYSIPLI